MESFCRQSVTSSMPGPATVTGCSSWCAQSTALRSSLPVVRRKHFPEGAVDVPGEVDHAAAARLARVKTSGMSVLGHAREDLLHGQVGVGGDQRERRVQGAPRGRVCTRSHAVDDAGGVFQARQNGVECAGLRVLSSAQVGVRAYAVSTRAVEGGAEQGRPGRSPCGARPTRRRARSRTSPRGCRRAPRMRGVWRHCAVGKRRDVGEDERTLNAPMCAASSRRSCTISNGMRASISAW